MWTQLAIATVSTTTGATAEGDVIGSPTQPPIPTAVIIDIVTTSIIANVPENPRVSSRSMNVIARKLAGMNVLRSLSDTSIRAWLKITIPANSTSMPGKRSRKSSARLRAYSVTSAPSLSLSSPGSCNVTLTPETPPSRASRRPARTGSARATARIRERSPASPRALPSTSSRTSISSPSAVVC